MIKQVYAVRDGKACIYHAPFTVLNEAVAVRMVHNAVNADDQGELSFNASDFDLYHLGEFDDESGKLDVFEAPKHVVHCAHLKDE